MFESNLLRGWILLAILSPISSAQTPSVLPCEQGKPSCDGLALGADGTLYLPRGYQSPELWKRAPDGTTELFATGLDGPIDCVVRPDGSLYVTCYNNRKVCHVSPEGAVSDFVEVGPYPCGIDLDSQGNLYVTTGVDGTKNPLTPVMKVTPDGTVSTWFQDPNLGSAVAIAIDDKDHCFVVSGTTGGVYRITPEGKASLFATIPALSLGPKIGYMDWAAGYLYVTTFAGMVWEIDSKGSVRAVIGVGTQRTHQGPPRSALWQSCNGIAVSEDGRTLFMGSGHTDFPDGRLVAIDLLGTPEHPLMEDVQLAAGRKQYKRIRPMLEGLLARDPEDYEAWYSLAQNLRWSGDLAGAVGAYETATESPKFRILALYNGACALALMGGKSEEAIDTLLAALDAGFNNPRALAEDPDLASIRGHERFPRGKAN